METDGCPEPKGGFRDGEESLGGIPALPGVPVTQKLFTRARCNPWDESQTQASPLWGRQEVSCTKVALSTSREVKNARQGSARETALREGTLTMAVHERGKYSNRTGERSYPLASQQTHGS